MTNCNCKEPCEDCKEEKADLDNVSSLLFNEINNKTFQKEKEQKQEIKPKKSIKKTKTVKSIKKIECENINYKDPVSEEYKLMWNNKIGCTVWKAETRNFTF